MHLTLDQLREATGGRLVPDGLPQAGGPRIARAVIDSRQVQPGDVFWALPGSTQDGADFVDDAYGRGAVAAVTARPGLEPPSGRWLLTVDDAQRALTNAARWKRSRFQGRLVAVTGSVGKTTTRLMIDTVLRSRFSGSTSPHNYNNHVGLPLAMLGLDASHDYGVYELGASAVGEIAALAALCQPHIGVLTCLGESHLAGFGSRDGLARAKTELLEALPADGWAVLPGDDPLVRKYAGRTKAQIVWVGRGVDCELMASRIESSQGRLRLRISGTEFDVPAWGRHHVNGVLAAAAVGKLLGVPLDNAAEALADFRPPKMRCQVMRIDGATFINDAYNASPTSMRSALALLRDFQAPGQRIVVCGDMRELGPATADYHRQLGDEVVTLCGADLLVACGSYAADVVGAARRAGMPAARTVACEGAEEAAEALRRHLRPGDVVLVKGSRSLGMEQVIEQLAARQHRRAA